MPGEGAGDICTGKCSPTGSGIYRGTTGQMREILDELFRLNPDIRIVINLIALESLTVLMSYLKERGIEAEILSIQIAKAEKIGSSHLDERAESDLYHITGRK